MKIALRAPSGKYVCAENGGDSQGIVHVDRDGVGPWEKFTVIDNGDDPRTISLQSSSGYYLSAEGGGGLEIHANRTKIGPWEKFFPAIVDEANVGPKTIILQTWDGKHYAAAVMVVGDALPRLQARSLAPMVFTMEILEGDTEIPLPSPPIVGVESGFITTYNHSKSLLYGFKDDKGRPWQMVGYQAHLLPVAVLKKQDIRPFVRNARDNYGANTLGTIGTHLSKWKRDNGFLFDPFTNEAKDAISIMFEVCAEEGMRVLHSVAADMQGMTDDQKRHVWDTQCEIMHGRWNLFASCGNESEANEWHPDLFNRYNLGGVLQSAGSVGIGMRPHQHYRDFSMWEGRRTDHYGWHKCLDDAGAGGYEQIVGYDDQQAIPVPTIMCEGEFFADTNPDHVGDHRSTDPEMAEQYGLQIGASYAGGFVGTSLGLEGKLDGAVAAECAKRQLKAMRAAFLRAAVY